MNDLESLLKRLVDHRVEFVIVGGYAAVAHHVTGVRSLPSAFWFAAPASMILSSGGYHRDNWDDGLISPA